MTTDPRMFAFHTLDQSQQEASDACSETSMGSNVAGPSWHTHGRQPLRLRFGSHGSPPGFRPAARLKCTYGSFPRPALRVVGADACA